MAKDVCYDTPLLSPCRTISVAPLQTLPPAPPRASLLPRHRWPPSPPRPVEHFDGPAVRAAQGVRAAEATARCRRRAHPARGATRLALQLRCTGEGRPCFAVERALSWTKDGNIHRSKKAWLIECISSSRLWPRPLGGKSSTLFPFPLPPFGSAAATENSYNSNNTGMYARIHVHVL